MGVFFRGFAIGVFFGMVLSTVGFYMYQKGTNIVIWGQSEKTFSSQKKQSSQDANQPVRGMPDLLQESKEGDQSSDREQFLKELTLFQNDQYHYSFLYPGKWHRDDSFLSNPLEETEMSDGSSVRVGGMVLFSNYENASEYTPETKPKDMFLVSVSVYERGNKNMHDLVTGLGFQAYDVKEFSGKNVSGNWYYAPGADEKNPLIGVVFEKNDVLFVIQPAFINGDTEVLSGVEEMAKSFEILTK